MPQNNAQKRFTWKGKPLGSLTKKELLVALSDAFQLIQDLQDFQAQGTEMDEVFARAAQHEAESFFPHFPAPHRERT